MGALSLLLIIVPVWLALGRADELGVIRTAAQATAPLVLTLLMLNCLALRAKTRMPRAAYIWITVAAVTLLGSVRTGALVDIAFRVQWIILVLAAFALVRVTTSVTMAQWILRRLTWSALVITAAFLAALLIDPEAAMRPGQDRFEPWGIGSNTAGHMLTFAVPLFAYQLTLPQARRHLWIVAMSVSLGMATISGARTTMAGIALAIAPPAFAAMRRMSQRRRSALVGVATLGVLAVVVAGVASLPERVRLDRYTTLVSPRSKITEDYLAAIAERPFTGLLFTDGQAGVHGAEQQHTHNVYLAWAYLGGLPIAALMTAGAAISVCGTVRLIGRNRRLGIALAGIVVAGWATGVTTIHIFHPSHPLALLHTYAALLAVRAASASTRTASRSAVVFGGEHRLKASRSAMPVGGGAWRLPAPARPTARPSPLSTWCL